MLLIRITILKSQYINELASLSDKPEGKLLSLEIRHSSCKSETESWLCVCIPSGCETLLLSTSVSSGFTLLIRVEFKKNILLICRQVWLMSTAIWAKVEYVWHCSNLHGLLGFNPAEVWQSPCTGGNRKDKGGQRMFSVLYKKKTCCFSVKQTDRVYGGCGSCLLLVLFGSLWQSLWDTVRMSTAQQPLYFLVFNHWRQ